MTKYIFVTGGVCSGLGKGITAASIAMLLKAKGYKVFMQKFNPYLNVNPMTLIPVQQKEVFITADGCEADLDLGHYERFIDEELNFTSNITSGKIYSNVIEKEKKGDYLGSDIQMVPHISDEIKNKIYEAGLSSKADILIVEIGGTVGDIESAVVLEALRQFRLEQGKENSLFVHTTLVPCLFGSNELKTKPTQNSLIELRRVGIQPDIIVTRAPINLTDEVKSKLSLFGGLPEKSIIEAIDMPNIYQIPLNFHKQEIEITILKQLNLEITPSRLGYWEDLVKTVDGLKQEIEIALVGKYTDFPDTYLSVMESLRHAGYKCKTKININLIDAEKLEKENADLSKIFVNSKGIIIPSGFGSRGVEGIIKAIEYARVNNVPVFGIALGMQLMAIEFARNICGIKGANSTEFNPVCMHPIIDLMSSQKSIVSMGDTLRIGNYECNIIENTLASKLYNTDKILERHRHRYEFNNKYKVLLEKTGLVFSGINEQTDLVEIIELPTNRFHVGCQFHPEFKSRPTNAHPLFIEFIKASLNK